MMTVFVLIGMWSGVIDSFAVYRDIEDAIDALCKLLDDYEFPSTDEPDTHTKYEHLDYYRTPDGDKEILFYHNDNIRIR